MNTKRARTLGLGTLLLLLLLGACGRVLESPAVPLTIRSTNVGCPAATEQDLRDAVADVDCSTVAVTGTISLTQTLTLGRDVTIEGSGTDATVERGPDLSPFRVIEVTETATVTLRNLTISGGSAIDMPGGGGVLNRGTLTIDDCAISDNTALYHGGGILNDGGTLTLTNSRVTQNEAVAESSTGGGIRNRKGTLTLTDTLVSDNVAEDGGGIYSSEGTLEVAGGVLTRNYAHVGGGGIMLIEATATVTQSTIAGNGAGALGGGLMNYLSAVTLERSTVAGNGAGYGGGGIFSQTTPLHPSQGTTLLNTTVSGNLSYVVGGGIFNREGTTRIVHSTVTANWADASGAGVYAGDLGEALSCRNEVKGSIVWGNTSGADVADDLAAATPTEFTSLGHNLIGAYPSVDLSSVFNVTGDRTGVDVDPLLGDLLPHAPGVTDTHALQAGSPALDWIPADDCAVAEDQRGVTRPQGSACDIGAFELEAATTLHATGFYEPVGVPNSVFVPSGTAPAAGPETIWNVARGNSTIPLKFNLYAYDGGPEITSTEGIAFAQALVACPVASAEVDQVDFTTTGSTSLRYDTTAGQFVQNWKAPKVSRDTCYLVGVTFPDESALYAFMRLRK